MQLQEELDRRSLEHPGLHEATNNMSGSSEICKTSRWSREMLVAVDGRSSLSSGSS